LNRLTEHDSDGNINFINQNDPEGGYYIRDLDIENDGELLCNIAEKLAEYEDTGLTPEEVKDHEEMFTAYRHVCGGKSPEKIKDLLDAEEQGLLLRLPCKPDSKVYRTGVVDGRKPVIDEYYAGLRFTVDNLNNFGKTVFLTREAAEAAMKGSVSE
jgi:hypothetical protein